MKRSVCKVKVTTHKIKIKIKIQDSRFKKISWLKLKLKWLVVISWLVVLTNIPLNFYSYFCQVHG
jgi:hypothetical protein